MIYLGDKKISELHYQNKNIVKAYFNNNVVYDRISVPESDIALYDNITKQEIVINNLDYNATDYPTNRYTPIGIVVIPKEHSLVLYPEGHECHGKPVMMSLKYMRYDTPDTGGDKQTMYWGGYGTDLTLQNYTKSAVVANETAEEVSTESSSFNSYLPSTNFSGTESKAAPKTKYHSNYTPYCPSPFLWKNKWIPNPAYYNCPETCVQRDRDGKGNTQVILDAVTVADWKTSMGQPAVPEQTENVQTTEGLTVVWATQSGTWDESELTDAYDGKKFACQSPGSSGSTVIRCTVSGKAGKLVFTCKTAGESSYDYLTIGELDKSCTRTTFQESMKGMSGQTKVYIFDIPDENEHYIEFCYSKDGSGDTAPDNAEVYIAHSGEVVTVPAQAATTPIVNDYSAGNYPAACCCWRFHTVADKQGDWYLPAAGELGYIMPFYVQHQNAVTRINNVYGSGFAVALLTDYHWSSSEYSGYYAYRVYTYNGTVYNTTKSYSYCVRAFRPVKCKETGEYDKTSDIVFLDTRKNEFIAVDYTEIENVDTTRYKIVGVVIVPSSHDVYGTGEAGVCYKAIHLDSTGLEYKLFKNKQYHDSILGHIPLLEVNSNGEISSTVVRGHMNQAYLPSQRETGIPSNDLITKYPEYSTYLRIAPSPYNPDGSRNPQYYQRTDICNDNCLSDFNGRQNTLDILKEIEETVPNWKSLSKEEIVDKIENPMACLLYKYTDDIVKEGDLYVPAIGELGYAPLRNKDLSLAYSAVYKKFGVYAYHAINEHYSSTESLPYEGSTKPLIWTIKGNGDLMKCEINIKWGYTSSMFIRRKLKKVTFNK